MNHQPPNPEQPARTTVHRLLDAVLHRGPGYDPDTRLSALSELRRASLSEALGLGNAAPWDAIRNRARELHDAQADRDGLSERLAIRVRQCDELREQLTALPRLLEDQGLQAAAALVRQRVNLLDPTALDGPAATEPERCCVCGGTAVTYHNWNEQPFCTLCANCPCSQVPCIRTSINAPSVAGPAATEATGASVRHVSVAMAHPDEYTANRSALSLADWIRAEFTDGINLTVTTDAHEMTDRAGPGRDPEPTGLACNHCGHPAEWHDRHEGCVGPDGIGSPCSGDCTCTRSPASAQETEAELAVKAAAETAAEEHRVALSEALGLGTSAPWDVILERANELEAAARRAANDDAELRRIRRESLRRADEAEQRAAAMEAAMQSTAADALKHRGCHRDLMAQCTRAERAEKRAEQAETVAAHQGELWRAEQRRREQAECALYRVRAVAADLARAGWTQAAIARRILAALDSPAATEATDIAENASQDEQLPPDVLDEIRPRLRPYVSTACDTAWHLFAMAYKGRAEQLHQRCPRTHEFTGQPCTCPCHQPREQHERPVHPDSTTETSTT